MRICLALFALGTLVAVACSNPTGSSDLCANSGAAVTLNATDRYAFTPSTVTVTIGQSVCWQNTGKLTHTVTDAFGRFGGNLPPGQTLVCTFIVGET
jgi:plastocyanin